MHRPVPPPSRLLPRRFHPLIVYHRLFPLPNRAHFYRQLYRRKGLTHIHFSLIFPCPRIWRESIYIYIYRGTDSLLLRARYWKKRDLEEKDSWLDNFYDQAMFCSPIFLTNLSAPMSRREIEREREGKEKERDGVLLVS